ncbi:MAG: thiamine pyrophosphate-dependent dehydrogenase E1 component subunit alpha [Nanoarchaeota archaeon]
MKHPAKVMLALYKSMLLIRRAEEKIAELYPGQEMRCPTHLCIGQEAVSAGVCLNLTRNDCVFSNHRAHGHYLAKGGSLKGMLAELYGKATGCSRGRGGSMHLIDLPVNFVAATPLVAGTIPVAVGTAFALKAQNKPDISVAFFGDSAVEEGVFHEAMNFASLHKLPVLFVCENNIYACQTHLRDRQPDRDTVKLAEGHAVQAYHADGNDAIAVYETAKKAVESIKSGNGPAFIEFLTYRWLEHCGPNEDKDLGYRSEKEISEWLERCPIKRLKKAMLAEKAAREEELEKVESEVMQEVEEAAAFAKESPFPEKHTLYQHLYSD